MFQDLEAGMPHDGYRYQWVKDSVLRVVDQLEEIADEFNRTHSDDRCSVQDFIDILNSAMRTLEQGRKRH